MGLVNGKEIEERGEHHTYRDNTNRELEKEQNKKLKTSERGTGRSKEIDKEMRDVGTDNEKREENKQVVREIENKDIDKSSRGYL